MRCLYEVLELESGADDVQIKSAYRRGALRWHPDKNQDNLEEAEARFREIQNAYEVLSDKHERAWYDAHRADILRQGGNYQAGGGPSAGFTPGQAPEDDINLFPFFSSTCFSGYSDGPTGFYGVYESIFSRLAQQEAAEQQSSPVSGSGRSEAPPLFGHSRAAWEQISGFYNFWLNFSTSKAFAWADQYNPASAPNRKVRRLMEAENQKARKAKRRDFNETVRELAAFVRKRDKRVAGHQAEQAQRQIQKEMEETKRREEERRERLQRAREYEEAAWAQDAEAAESSEEAPGNIIPDELYCLACDKTFRSENALANHEKSKKHLEKVAAMREMLEEEELREPLSHQSDRNGEAAEPSQNGWHSAGEPRAHAEDESSSKSSYEHLDELDSREPRSETRDDEGDGSEAAVTESSSQAGSEKDDLLEALLQMQIGRQQNTAARRQASSLPELQGKSQQRKDPVDSQSAAAVHQMLKHVFQEPDLSGEALQPESASAGSSQSAGETNELQPEQRKPRRRAKQKTLAASQPGNAPSTAGRAKGRRKSATTGKAAELEEKATCAVCGACFASRTKLFQHIKQQGHAALKQ